MLLLLDEWPLPSVLDLPFRIAGGNDDHSPEYDYNDGNGTIVCFVSEACASPGPHFWTASPTSFCFGQAAPKLR